MTRLMITIEDLYTIYLAHPVVSTDTRQLPKGCIFLALRGARFDGNQYARAALEAGATLHSSPRDESQPIYLFSEFM